jgi:Kef-type K+ transport system membrane component KefB
VSVLLALVALLLAARLAGELAVRVGQSPMLGEILAGLVLGPTLLNLVHTEPSLDLLSHLGILFLMFLAGLDTDLRLIRKVAGPSVAVSLAGACLSLALGYGVGVLFGLSSIASVFLAAALSTSSIVVTARVLDDYGMMRSEVGLLCMATNAIDDVISMFIVLLVVSLVGQSGHQSIPWMLGKLVIYSVAATAVGLLLFRPLLRWVGRMRSDEMYFTAAVVLVLGFAWSADALGLADVLGAFLAGAFLHQTEEAEPTMVARVQAVSDGFLVPIFFATMGLTTDLRELGGALAFGAVVIVVAVVGKLVGSGLGARLAGYGWRDSFIVGAGMVPRAEMTLVLLGIGHKAGVLPPVLPPLLISLVFLTALLTGPLLRAGLPRAAPESLPAT